MTELWLIRHGQTDWNLTGRWQGQAADAPGLNATGYSQVLTLRDHIPHVRLSAIYSSDLLRARQTAELLAKSLELTVTLEPRLREINLGVWEGMLSADIAAQYPQELSERSREPLHSHAPRGESVMEVVERVREFVSTLVTIHKHESVLIVAHGVVLAIIICLAQDIPLTGVYEHIPENAQPYLVEWK
jgi:broad specificity phosphatase PhoE